MRVVVPFLCVVLAALAPAAVAAQPPDTSAGFQINAEHTGEVLGSGLAPPLAVAWTRTDLGQASYPVIADGKVVVVIAADDPTVVALDARTGETAWSAVLGEQYSGWSSLAYGDGRVFTLDDDGRLQAFDIDTGARLWANQYTVGASAAPTVRDGVVYFVVDGSSALLRAVRATDGSELWMARLIAGGGHSAPAVDGDSVYLAYACENVYRVDRATGAQVWWHRTGCSGGGGNSPVVVGDRVYIRDGQDEPSLALNKADGATVASFWSETPVAFSGTTMLTSPDWVLTAGTWTFGGTGFYLSTAPVVANGVAYVGAATGRMYGIDVATGAKVWQGFAGAQVPWFNDSTATVPWPGLGIGQGLLVAPTTKGVTAFTNESALPPWEPIEPAPTPAPGAGEAAPTGPARDTTPPAPFAAAAPPIAPAPRAAATPLLAPISAAARGRVVTVRTRLAAPARVTLTVTRAGKRVARVTRSAPAGALTLRATVRARGTLGVTVRAGDLTRSSSITVRR